MEPVISPPQIKTKALRSYLHCAHVFVYVSMFIDCKCDFSLISDSVKIRLEKSPI